MRSRLHQGQGHSRSNCKCFTFYQQAGGGPSTERHSCYVLIFIKSKFYFKGIVMCERTVEFVPLIIVWELECKGCVYTQ